LFVFGEAFQGMRRHLSMGLATVSTVAVAMWLMGGIAYAYWELDKFGQGVSRQFEMRAFFLPGTRFDAIRADIQALRNHPAIHTVQHIPRDLAWQKFREENPRILTEGIENPFPDAIKVVLRDLAQAETAARAIEDRPNIDRSRGVTYLAEEQRLVDQLRALLRWLAGTVGALLLVTSGILIFNAIRLAIVARRVEMRVMHLVGASRFTLRAPFLIEGAILGALGGGLAAALLYGSYTAVVDRILSQSIAAGTAPFPTSTVLALLVGAGALFGLVLSWLALFTTR
jgi:cell division transport system permease protein